MTAVLSPLMREWNLLQEEVIPPLVEVERSRQPSVWSVGSAADAVAVAVAFNHAQGHGDPDSIRVFTSESSHEIDGMSFGLADIKCVPASSRSACFSRRDRRWVPDAAIAERVVMTEPAGLVDLVTVRAQAVQDRALPAAALDRLRSGGQLLLVDPSVDFRPPAGLQPIGRDGRVFRKCSTGGMDGPDGAVDHRALESEISDRPTRTLARCQLEADLVESHLRLARSLARRFVHHGEPPDDLEQVALLALVKAARRFDATRESAFATYATASILGEIKRHFRDKTWMLRVPRSLQELYLSIKDAREELSHQLGATPTIPQIADRLGVSEEALLEAMDAGDSYWPTSLDIATEDGPVIDIAVVDDAFDRSLDREQLRDFLPRLDEREQLILQRLYLDGWTQRQVAEEIGISQMQVSRILSRTKGQLRAWMGG
jgi:RNA polymerase sigma-B factor